MTGDEQLSVTLHVRPTTMSTMAVAALLDGMAAVGCVEVSDDLYSLICRGDADEAVRALLAELRGRTAPYRAAGNTRYWVRVAEIHRSPA